MSLSNLFLTVSLDAGSISSLHEVASDVSDVSYVDLFPMLQVDCVKSQHSGFSKRFP
jgi:hypothetical protein